jgi:tetratricopeptide (TPR) repeat protein
MRFSKLFLLLLLSTTFSVAQVFSVEQVKEAPSPAQLSITRAQAAISKSPSDSHAYVELAMALARRARETSDVSFYTQADEALEQSLRVKPDNFEALKAQTWILLGKHEFSRALELATRLQKQNPDDVTVYGYLTDANVELGDYKAAEQAAQWMLNLRPGNIAGLTRGAYLRELFGDFDGAAELMQMAYDSTPASEREDRAWILTQLAHLEIAQGHLSNAESLLKQALELFPDYHYALGNLARVRIMQKRWDEAITLLSKRYEHARHAENLFDLAEALALAGRKAEARQAFAEFEAKSLRESQLSDNSNHELARYYADYARKPADALRIAEMELKRRQDVNTLDVYAWALYANHRYREAEIQIQRVLAVGVHDKRFFDHAAAIAAHNGNAQQSRLYSGMSRDLEPRN